jgi:hypothetical protein
VIDPESKVSVQQRERAAIEVRGSAPNADPTAGDLARLASRGGDIPMGALGSGSDYSAFLERLGIASLNIGFAGEADDSGIYHSRGCPHVFQTSAPSSTAMSGSCTRSWPTCARPRRDTTSCSPRIRTGLPPIRPDRSHRPERLSDVPAVDLEPLDEAADAFGRAPKPMKRLTRHAPPQGSRSPLANCMRSTP